jgi:protein TonB
MNRALIIFYAVALAFHAVVLFWLKPPAPKPPKIFNETYVDVTLTTPSPPQPETKPIVVPPEPQPKIETPPPKPEEKPQPPPTPEMPIPEIQPEPPPQPEPSQPVVVPQPPPTPEISFTQRPLGMLMSNDYPLEAKRRHQQGTVTLMVFISEQGVADKVEVLKSSGHPVLDSDAIRKVKTKNWGVILQDGIPIRSSGTVTVPYILRRQ